MFQSKGRFNTSHRFISIPHRFPTYASLLRLLSCWRRVRRPSSFWSLQNGKIQAKLVSTIAPVSVKRSRMRRHRDGAFGHFYLLPSSHYGKPDPQTSGDSLRIARVLLHVSAVPGEAVCGNTDGDRVVPRFNPPMPQRTPAVGEGKERPRLPPDLRRSVQGRSPLVY